MDTSRRKNIAETIGNGGAASCQNGGRSIIRSTATTMSSSNNFLGKLAQDLDALIQLGVGGGVADAEMGVAVGEDIAGDDEDVFVDGAFDEVGAGDFAGDFGEDIEGAAGWVDFEKIGEAADDAVAFFAVGVDVGLHVDAAGEGRAECSVLHHRGGADEGVLLELGHLVENGFGAGGVAETPAGHAVCFRITLEQDALAGEERGDGDVGLVGERVVDFVGDHEEVVLFVDFRRSLKLRLREGDAGGVVWRAEDEHLGAA